MEEILHPSYGQKPNDLHGCMILVVLLMLILMFMLMFMFMLIIIIIIIIIIQKTRCASRGGNRIWDLFPRAFSKSQSAEQRPAHQAKL